MNVTSIINREKRKRQEGTSHVIKKKYKNWNMLNSLEGNTQNGIASTSFRTKKVHTSEYTLDGVGNISSNHCVNYDDYISLDKATSAGMHAYTQDGSALVPFCNNPDMSLVHSHESPFHLDVAVGGGEEVYRQHGEREKQGWKNDLNGNGVNKLKRIRGKKPTRGELKGNEKKKRENGVGGSHSAHIRNRGHTSNHSNCSSQSRCYCSPSSSSCSSSCCDNRSSDFSESHGSQDSYGSSSRASKGGRNQKRRKFSEGNQKPSSGDCLWEGLLKRDVILLLIQAIKNMGYKKSAKHLELESGIELEQPIVKEMHKNVLAGKWKNAYHFAALRCLRNKLAKFCFDEDTYNRLHECTTFFMSMNNAHLIKKRKQNYQAKVKSSRKLLFEKMNRLLPEHVIIPPRRLAILLHQSLKYQVDNCLFHNNFSDVKRIRALLQGKEGPEELYTANGAKAADGVNVTDVTDSSDPNDKMQNMPRCKLTPPCSAACQAKTLEFKKEEKLNVNIQVGSASNPCINTKQNTNQEDEMNISVRDIPRYHENVRGACSMYYHKANPKYSHADFGGSDAYVSLDDTTADKGIPCEFTSNETLLNDPPPDKPDNYTNTTTLLWDDDLLGENQFNITSGQPVRKNTKLKCVQLPREAEAARFAPDGKVHTPLTRESTSSSACARVNASEDTLFTNPFPCLKESIVKNAKSTACRKYAKVASDGPKICTLKESRSEQRKGEVTLGKIPNAFIIGKQKIQQGNGISGSSNMINVNDDFTSTQEKEFLIGHAGGNESDGSTTKGESAPLEGCKGEEETLYFQTGEDIHNVRLEGKHGESEMREERRSQFTRQDRAHSGIYEEADRKTFPLSLLKNHQCKKIKLPYYCIKILQGHKDEVWYVNVSKNGKYIASASKDKSIILWKGLYPFNKLREWNGHLDGVSYVVWSHNSKYLVSGSNDSNIIIWSPKSNKKKLILTMHNGPITSIYWSKDDSTIISSAFDKKIYCTKLNKELKGFSILYVWSFSTRIQNFVFTNNEKYLIAVPSDKNVRVIDFALKKELYILPEYDTITSVCASSLYNHILVNIADQRPTVKLWDVKHRYIIQTYRGHKQGRFIVHSTFGGKKEDYVISGSEDSLIYIWHKTKGFLLDVINGHASTVSIAIWPLASSKFPYMVSASDDHTIMVWNVHPRATTIRKDSRRRRKKFVHPFLRELAKFRPIVR
eukprot:XP_002259629.1 WD repeat protein, putative [Plasmodium knowlesi strain H]